MRPPDNISDSTELVAKPIETEGQSGPQEQLQGMPSFQIPGYYALSISVMFLFLLSPGNTSLRSV